MMLGLDLVSIHKSNVSLNGLILPQREPIFQNGMNGAVEITVSKFLH